MHLSMAPRVAFRASRPDRRPQDFVAHAARPTGEDLLVLANVYEGGFSTCSPPLSRFFLDALVGRFLQGEGPEPSLQGALAAFFDAYPADAEDPWVYDPAVSFAALWRGPAGIRAAALGGELVRTWRGGAIHQRFPADELRVFRLPNHTTVLRTAERDGRHPIAWTTLEPADTIELLSFRLAEHLGDQPGPRESEDPRLVALMQDAAFGAWVGWGG